MVVLPLPVGEDTPIRVTPLSSADRQSWMHSSWYGRREIVEEEASMVAGGAVASDRRSAELVSNRIGGGLRMKLCCGIVTLSA